jgi:hypothetical protein
VELLISLGVSALLVAGYCFLKRSLKSAAQIQDSALKFSKKNAACQEAERNAPRVLVKLSTTNVVSGWAPCQFVTVPDGEYLAWPATFNDEAAVCFADVEQTWNGELMRRDVYVRIADYAFLQAFPTDSEQLRLMSMQLPSHKSVGKNT